MSDRVLEPTPDVALKQVLELAESLGYSLGVVALTPKTRTPIPIVEYLPDGVELQLVMLPNPRGLPGAGGDLRQSAWKVRNGNHALLPEKS